MGILIPILEIRKQASRDQVTLPKVLLIEGKDRLQTPKHMFFVLHAMSGSFTSFPRSTLSSDGLDVPDPPPQGVSPVHLAAGGNIIVF